MHSRNVDKQQRLTMHESASELDSPTSSNPWFQILHRITLPCALTSSTPYRRRRCKRSEAGLGEAASGGQQHGLVVRWFFGDAARGEMATEGAEHNEPHDSRGRRATGARRCALGGEVKKMELRRGLAGCWLQISSTSLAFGSRSNVVDRSFHSLRSYPGFHLIRSLYIGRVFCTLKINYSHIVIS
jgi:hypothetical protein